MLIATLIITTVAVVRRWARRSATANPAERRPEGAIRRALRRPIPVAAAVALLGIAETAGTLAQC
ncbi:hypothetical protein AB0H00_12160 [Nocardia sp. NPDC023852]|uniref:hypothetical protein n=1 Tax=Nocardia sp. NPDC023852 TaxID=3154697 RepID=UPI0034077EDA